MKNRKRKGRRFQSNRALRASGTEVKDTVPVPKRKTGDMAIFVRAPDSEVFEPFNGKGLGGEPMRWPFFHRQHVTAIAQSLGENNPGYELEIRYLPDTAYEEFDYKEYEDSYRPDLKDTRFDGPMETRPIKGQSDIGRFGSRIVLRGKGNGLVGNGGGWAIDDYGSEDPGMFGDVSEMQSMEAYARAHPDPRDTIPFDNSPMDTGFDPFDDPYYEPGSGWAFGPSFTEDEDDLPGFVTASDYPVKGGKRTDRRVSEISATPVETYTTQTHGVKVVTGTLEGRLTPDRKANAIGTSIMEMSGGRTVPLKDTIRRGVYYGVQESDAPEIGETRRILVTGKVMDNGDRTFSVDLTQSDTGSPYLDVPRTYMSMLDPPVTEQDVEYRRRVGERFDGDGRPWSDRRYSVDGRFTTPDKVVSKLARFTKRTEREAMADPVLRGMRVHDSVDMGSEGLLVRTFGRRNGR